MKKLNLDKLVKIVLKGRKQNKLTQSDLAEKTTLIELLLADLNKVSTRC